MSVVPPPPALKDLPLGTQLIAGLGKSTVIADFDFETFSPAGYIWDGKSFHPPAGAQKKGLPAVGAAVYAEHPEAEVLSLAYNLKDGRGPRVWQPGETLPYDLFGYLEAGGLIEAWNVGFEAWIWDKVCVPKYGFPALPSTQLRCAKAKGQAYGLPPSLATAGEVLKIPSPKDTDGKRLIEKFCVPQNPTKKQPNVRIYPHDDPQDFLNMISYNKRDIEAEAEISSFTPDLSPFELQFWQCDQAINRRGVQVDVNTIKCCISIVEQAHKKYNTELKDLMKDDAASASRVGHLKTWVVENTNLSLTSLNKQSISQALDKTDIPSEVRRVLEIRELIGSAAVKKPYAMLRQATSSGRIHDLFLYHSARTGRAAGTGPQPQNLPNSGPSVYRCVCGKHYGTHNDMCPWCGYSIASAKRIEWDYRAMEDAIFTIRTGDLAVVERYWGNALAAMFGCLRGLFIAGPGKRLICSDYSAIEAVVLAMLAGERWRIEVFKTHGKIYEASAAKITGTSFDEIINYEKTHDGAHHPLRKLGKVAELACFPPDTQVLTDRGYISIMDVTKQDKLWDGVQWVKHQGVILKGKRSVIEVDGVRMTPTHPVYIGDFWREAKELVLNENILSQALEIGSENLPLIALSMAPVAALKSCGWIVRAVGHLIRSYKVTSLKAQQLDVTCALKKLQSKVLNIIGHMRVSFQTKNIAVDYLTEFPQRLDDAIVLRTEGMQVTGEEEFMFMKGGEKINVNSSHTSSPFKVGMTQNWKWIGLMSTKVMNPKIFVSYLVQKIQKIKEAFTIWKKKSDNLSDVYDIVNAGSNSRFTIKTKTGHLIVHNSGYQGALGAWTRFGAHKHLPNDDEILKAVWAWRDASPKIVDLWRGLESAAKTAIRTREACTYGHISYKMVGRILHCILPSGRSITYHDARIEPGVKGDQITYWGWNTNPTNGAIGWTKQYTYGGKLTENVVQAIARDILAHAIVNLERAGYPVVLHVHDEIVCEVPQGQGSLAEFEAIMSTMPPWAWGWPVKAVNGWEGQRYRK